MKYNIKNINIFKFIILVNFIFTFSFIAALNADETYRPTANANILPLKKSVDQSSWDNRIFSMSQSNQNIIFLGGTDTVEQDLNGYLETLLTIELVDYRPKFFNFGWQADTVYKQQRPRYFYSKNKFNEGIADQRKKFAADNVFIRYGKMESYDGITNLIEFEKAYRLMIQNVKKFTKRIVVMTPYPFESSGPLSTTANSKNRILEEYVKKIQEIAAGEGCIVIDLFNSLRDIFSEPVKKLTRDGLLLNDYGHWIVAQEIVRQLGLDKSFNKEHDITINMAGVLWPSDWEELRQRIIVKNGLVFEYFRPTNWAFLFGNRQQTPSSWYHYGGDRWFPQEIQKLVTMIEKAQHEIYSGIDEYNSSIEENKSLIVDNRFEVNLFADESLGVANPIAINWDPMGRLWVLCSMAYPQLEPGGKGNDKLFIIEDRDKDGKAESSRVFVDNLEMPTGFAIGNGGAYIGQGTDLIHFKDLDHDGVSDTKEIIFTGFGTDDTHQNINSFTWSPDGYLYFCQGMHAFSRVETPWGISAADESAVWRLHLDSLRLQPYMSGNMSADNPWGIAFGTWGEMYLKGNDQQIYDAMPAMIPTKHYSRMEDGYGLMGRTKAKSMALEIVDTSHLPEDFQGCFLVAGYFDRSIERFRIEKNGSISKAVRLKKFIVGKHPAFRPVDIKIGPDGAIYIADWFNLIINHYQESLRHPKRDKLHGRIWRVKYKSKPLLTAPNLTSLPLGKLFDQLKNKESWARYQTRRLIAELPRETVKQELDIWLSELNSENKDYIHHIYEALSICQIHQIYRFDLLNILLKSKDFKARAYAARVMGQWHTKMDNPFEQFLGLITDSEPRVRLEALVALSHIESPKSIKIALKALDSELDSALEYALSQTVHALAPYWLPELKKSGVFFDNTKHAIFALSNLGSEETSELVRNLLKRNDNSEEVRNRLLILLAHIGNESELMDLIGKANEIPGLLDEIVNASKKRMLSRPHKVAISHLANYINAENEYLSINAMKLTAQWDFVELAGEISGLIIKKETPAIVIVEGIKALTQLYPNKKNELYHKLVDHHDVKVRNAAVLALCKTDLNYGVPVLVDLLLASNEVNVVNDLIKPFLEIDGATKKLALFLNDQPITRKIAEAIIKIMNEKGRDDSELQQALARVIGKNTGRETYSKSYVKKLIEDSILNGNAKQGRKVFMSPLTACSVCHQIDEIGGMLGPDLTTVSSGITPEILVESIIWPERQIKEGYAATRITTKSGDLFHGYFVRNNKSDGIIRLKDPSTGEIRSVLAKDIVKRSEFVSLMPKGLTTLLSPEDLRNLVKYLLECK